MLRYDRIEVWKEDLIKAKRDKSLPHFNFDFEILPHEKRKWQGDPALFLAWRFANPSNDKKFDLWEWYADKAAAQIVELFTGIPIGAASQLLNPPVNINYSKITAVKFVEVLDVYLFCNKVEWKNG